MLGLATATDDAWIEAALADIDALLVDHAHCEMKAASNALSLAVRYGERPHLVTALTALAEEEIGHFRRVHAMLVERGVPLGPPPVDPYAAELRKAVSRTLPRSPTVNVGLVERLLVAAVIEARSCERFRILSERAPSAQLRTFYGELLISEAGHYRLFLDLAISEGERDGVDALTVRTRMRALVAEESGIVARLAHTAPTGASRATMHG